MKTSFAVFNSKNGNYSYFDTRDEALDFYVQMIMEFCNNPFYKNVYCEVIKNDDGSETWKSESGEVLKNISSYEISRRLQNILRADQLTRVEVLE